MKKILIKIAHTFLPKKHQLALRYLYRKLFGSLDPEMAYVNKLLDDRNRFIDIGANLGIYSFYYSSRMENIDAFEPLEEVTDELMSLNNEKITLHNIALSNNNKELKFYIPMLKGRLAYSLASIEPREGHCEERIIKVAQLDEFKFRDVDLIKIDVEGHEAAVIEGATETIRICKPILIIEIEQRHIQIPVEEIFENILSLGYVGFFLENKVLKSIKYFSYQTHQEPYLLNVSDNKYVNNFIFRPT